MIVFGIEQCTYCNKLKNLLDENNFEYRYIDVNTDYGSSEFEKFYKITQSRDIPVVLINKRILAPKLSYNTIDQCFEIIKSLS